MEYCSSPATGTKHTLKPLYSLDYRGFLVLKLSIPAKIPAKDNFSPQIYICALLIGGGGSLWLFGIVSVPTRILKKPISKKAAQSLVSSHP